MRASLIAAAIIAATAIACAPKGEKLADATPAPGAEDTCGKTRYANLIGQPRTEIPAPANVTVRVACTACPVTQDYQPARLNFFFNETTNLIERITCG